MKAVECCDNRGRMETLEKTGGKVNGIRYVEHGECHLIVHLYAPADPCAIKFVLHDIERGERIDVCSNDVSCTENTVRIDLHTQLIEGASYRLQLCKTSESSMELDPRFSEASVVYNNTVNTETDFLRPEPARESVFASPSKNYLAKDYASFRQLILDRLAITMPNWRETHAADMGMTLVELFAFAADRISYEQDAVATEAYIATARQRVSVRRHARLVDYRMHDGCNARTFLFLNCVGNFSFAPKDLLFCTEFPRRFQLPDGVLPYDKVPEQAWTNTVVFEAIPRPLDDWRITSDQVKSFPELTSRVSKGTKSECSQGDGNPTLTLNVLRIFMPEFLWDIAPGKVDGWIGEVNEWLNEVDLLEEANRSEEFYQQIQRFIPQLSNLSVPQRNRFLLDVALSDSISATNLSERITLYEAHNEIHFYTWDETQCSLPKGATRATLCDYAADKDLVPSACASSPSDKADCGRLLCHLNVGDYLLFEEIRGPLTGSPADADRTKRHVVRLTKIESKADPVKHNDIERKLLEIEWAAEDALPFALCISSKRPPPFCDAVPNVSVARGNIILVDHGRTLERVEMDVVESETHQVDCGSDWMPPAIERTLHPYRPVIHEPTLTFAEPMLTPKPATQSIKQDITKAVPSISLLGVPSADNVEPIRVSPDFLESDDGDRLRQVWNYLRPEERHVLEDLLSPEQAYELVKLLATPSQLPAVRKRENERLRQLLKHMLAEMTWEPRFDLLDSDANDRHFVVETDDRRRATLRFGDGEHGRRIESGTKFYAQYRVGSGGKGNVGADMITRVVVRQNVFPAISMCRNPMPSQGGTEPETIEQAKLLAPHAFRKNQPRALVADDYRALVMAKFAGRVQSAFASRSSGRTFDWIDVVIDAMIVEQDLPRLLHDVQTYLDHVRKIGHRVRVTQQVSVPIDLRMTIVVDSRFSRQVVRKAIAQRISNQTMPDGSLGFFHPDSLRLGQSIHSNEIVREVLKVDGVLDAVVTYFARWREPCQTNSSATEAHAKPAESTVVIPWHQTELEFGPLEIAQLDTNRKAGGQLSLTLEGGR